MTGSDQQTIDIQLFGSLDQIAAADWDACACPEVAEGRAIDPFTTYRFLHALEVSGSVGPGTGWQPQYLSATQNGQMIACAPLYAKSHSQGEYVFDHNWAHAYERAGGRYYPKLQLSVPFSPVTGPRLLVPDGPERQTHQRLLLQGTKQVADHIHAVHQGAFNYFDRTIERQSRLFGIFDDIGIVTLDQGVLHSLGDILFTPAEVFLSSLACA